jgi:hypothetical protein
MKSKFTIFYIFVALILTQVNAQDIDLKNEDGIITNARYFDFYQQNKLILLDLQGDYTLAISYFETINNLMAALKIKKPQELEKLPHEVEQLFFNMHPAETNLNTNNYQLYDPELDEEEIESLGLNPKDKKLTQHLIGEEILIEGKKKPFKTKKILNMFKQVMYEEFKNNNIKPTLGEFHEFHATFKEKYKNVLPFTLRFFNKIFLSLAKGVTSKFMFTEQEKNLLTWILQQPVNSISIEAMFRRSYQLNQGNIYLTLLTIENILSYNWKSTSDDRESREVTLRLKRITHYIGKGDKFGHWYHLFGIMLYGLYKGRITAQFVAETESLGSLILSKFKNEKQENMINRFGAIIGARLQRISDGQFLNTWQNQPEYLSESYYLNDQKKEHYTRKLRREIKKRNKNEVD